MVRKCVLAGIVTLIGFVYLWCRYIDDYLRAYDSRHSSHKAHHLNIGIITVLDKSSSRMKYKTAMETMECYAIRHNYTYKVLFAVDYGDVCIHKDITFQRHCIIAKVLESFDWILFVDADTGVVNENRKLEDFLESHNDIIFYDRFFNHEIMAGSYLARRSNFSARFLHGWADYEFSLPKSFHGRDNGALHMWMVKQSSRANGQRCEQLWNASTDYTSLSYFTVCCREVLRRSNVTKIRIREKVNVKRRIELETEGQTTLCYNNIANTANGENHWVAEQSVSFRCYGQGWARDGWLTNSHWNPMTDFMFHGRKEADKMQFNADSDSGLSGPTHFPWFNTLSTPVILGQCRMASRWRHNPKLVVSAFQILRHLEGWKQKVLNEYQSILEELGFGDPLETVIYENNGVVYMYDLE